MVETGLLISYCEIEITAQWLPTEQTVCYIPSRLRGICIQTNTTRASVSPF